MIVSSFLLNCLKKSSAVLCVIMLLITACKEQVKEQKAPEATAATSAPFVNPPIKTADVPYEEYNVDAAKGDTLIYKSGSVILFPPNAFVDEAGNPVTGNVQVKYREFKDAVDIFLAGIPMQYDSAGTLYQFESSGMFDIRAFKDGKPVFVNKANKPEVNLVSNTNSDKYSLYFLDTVQKQWINNGGMQIIERRDAPKANKASAPALTELPEPVKPLKADNKSPVLKIEVDPSSFREFAIYKNLKFQVDESKTRFNTKDSEEEWNNLELLKGSQPGTYMAKFTNANKSVTYAVKPVFTGSDYDKAMKAFEKEYAVYKQQATNRAIRDKAAWDKNQKDYEQKIAENKRIERLNAIIDQKNREIDRQNAITIAENKEIIRRNTLNVVYRSFNVASFGVFNCDWVVTFVNGVSLIATYKDTSGNVLHIPNSVSVIYKLRSIVATYFPSNITVVPGADITIVAAFDGKLAYVSSEEYRKLNIKADTKEQTFIMKVVDVSNLNYEYIRGLFKN